MRNKTKKQKLKTFLAIKEAVMIGLVLLSLAFLALEYLGMLSIAQLYAVDAFEVLLALLFVAEFVFEWYHARDRTRYVRTHWFYLLAAIPIPTQTFEILRGIRLLRLMKFFKIFIHMEYENNTKLFSSVH